MACLQALLDISLPAPPSGPGSRNIYTPTHSNHYHHHIQQPASSTPHVYDAAAAAAAGFPGYPGFTADGAAMGYDGGAGFAGFNPAQQGYYSPMPSLSGLQQEGSPAPPGVAVLDGGMHAQQQHQQHMMLYGAGQHVGQLQQYMAGQQLMTADANMAATSAGMLPGGAGNSAQEWQMAAAGAAAAAPNGNGMAYGFTGMVGGGLLPPGGMLTEQQLAMLSMQQQQQQQ